MSSPIALGTSGAPPSPPNSSTAKALTKVDRSKVEPEIREAAESMEGMFVDYMFKAMRQTVPKNEMDLESPATEIYRGMLDSEYAEKAVKAGGVGLAEQIIAYLESQKYNGNQVHGGIDASQSIHK